MCGIAGILRLDRQAVCERNLQAMSVRLIHRGPDGGGLLTDGPAGLVHRRLSIIDLEGGRQPLCNEDGRVHITFNGEIYNFRELKKDLVSRGHRFRTESDTEVVVHAWEQWGPECVHRLRGMFAFAIWDSRQQTLFLARDRVGIKPLLYTVQQGYVAFASEMQALTCLPDIDLSVSTQAIDLYLHYQYIPAPFSIYQQVRKLPPGHSLVIRPGYDVPQPERYWSLKFYPDRSLSESQWLEKLDAALEETVAAHLVADVPFGAFLSGGLDSSTVVAYMSRLLKEPVQAFCIGHSDSAYDERNWASEAASVCGANYHEELVEPDGLDLLPELVRHYGEPFADSSAIPTWYVSRLARRHVKMVLSGDGGDELFAGYYAYPAILSNHRAPESLSKKVRHFVANQARRAGLKSPLTSMADSKYLRTGVLSHSEREELWHPEFHSALEGTRQQFDRQFESARSSETLNHLQAFDIENYIPFDNLTKVDIASMCHGLEVRVPLLDHVFMETVATIPPELRLHPNPGNGNGRLETLQSAAGCVGKYLLKRNAERFYSSEFIHREKRGFEVPIRNWFAGPHRDQLHERLCGSGATIESYFRADAVASLVRESSQNKVAAWKAWTLLVLDEFLSQQKHELPLVSCQSSGKL